VLFVSAHWDQLSPGGRYLLVIAMVAVFHIAGGLTRSNFEASPPRSTPWNISTGAPSRSPAYLQHPGALAGRGAAVGAGRLAGWALLRDQAQQTLALLLLLRGSFRNSASAWKATSAAKSTWAALLSLGDPLPHLFAARAQGGPGILFAASAIGAAAHLLHAG